LREGSLHFLHSCFRFPADSRVHFIRRLLVVTFLEALLLNLVDSGVNEPHVNEDVRSRLLSAIVDLCFGNEDDRIETLKHLSSDTSDAQRPQKPSSSSKPFGSLTGSSGDHSRLNFEVAWKEFHRHAFVEAYSKIKWTEKLPPFSDLETGKSVSDPSLSSLKGGIIPSCTHCYISNNFLESTRAYVRFSTSFLPQKACGPLCKRPF
jgi:hypothetical protein